MYRFEQDIQKALEEAVFPGAALLVASKGEILYRNFFGKSALLPSPVLLTENTLFDIASLTKPLATMTLTLVTCLEKGLSLNASVSRYFKTFGEEDKNKITVRHLLKHTSGLPAWKPYFEEISKTHPELVGKRESRSIYLDKISQEPLVTPVAYQRLYSDLGFIVLGILLEEIWQKPLDQLFSEEVPELFNLQNTFYLPVGGTRSDKVFAATEKSDWRGKIICGEVHDDNAYTLGGVAGHAGLFSTVDDLHLFLTGIEKGIRGEHPHFSRDLFDEFLGPKVKTKLGWDTPSLENSHAGHYFSKNSIGHLGYSGCSFWTDLDQDFHIILLTNRVHPTSQNESIKQFRPKIHDLIFEELLLTQT